MHRRARFSGPLQPPPATDLVSNQCWKSSGLWAIDSINAGSFRSAKHYLATSGADEAILQETKAGGPALGNLRKDAKRTGWQTAVTEAKNGPRGGRSGGSAVLTKRCFVSLLVCTR